MRILYKTAVIVKRMHLRPTFKQAQFPVNIVPKEPNTIAGDFRARAHLRLLD